MALWWGGASAGHRGLREPGLRVGRAALGGELSLSGTEGTRAQPKSPRGCGAGRLQELRVLSEGVQGLACSRGLLRLL